jgi:hypothetical protein
VSRPVSTKDLWFYYGNMTAKTCWVQFHCQSFYSCVNLRSPCVFGFVPTLYDESSCDMKNWALDDLEREKYPRIRPPKALKYNLQHIQAEIRFLYQVFFRDALNNVFSLRNHSHDSCIALWPTYSQNAYMNTKMVC